jgi:hypothetical protein
MSVPHTHPATPRKEWSYLTPQSLRPAAGLLRATADPLDLTDPPRSRRLEAGKARPGCLLSILLLAVAFVAYRAFLEWSSKKVEYFVVADPTARKVAETVIGATDAKSEEQLKAAYQDYLTAHRSFSTLGSADSQPMSFDEFKKAHAQRAANALRALVSG